MITKIELMFEEESENVLKDLEHLKLPNKIINKIEKLLEKGTDINYNKGGLKFWYFSDLAEGGISFDPRLFKKESKLDKELQEIHNNIFNTKDRK